MAAYPPGPTRMVDLPAYGANSAPTDRMWIASASVGFAAGAAADRYITPNDFLAEITRNISDLTLQFGDGVSGTVSAAGKGKIRYNNTAGSFQVSENGGAYQNLLKGSGTATRVAFWSAADELSSDAALYWQNTDKRLGIGVGTTPDGPLDVLADGAALAQQWRQNGGPLRVQMILDSVPEASLGTTTNHTFHLLTNNLQRLTVENGGLVGINKASLVQAQLQVVSQDATTETLILNSAASPSVNIAEFYNDNSLRFAFSPAANLGIGLSGAGGATGSITFNGITSGAVTMTVAAAAGTWTLTLPTTAGSAGQFLQTNGAGVTTWATAGGGTPASPVNSVQFNNAGAFGGSSNMLWDNTNNRLLLGVTVASGQAPLDVLADGTALAQQWRQNGGSMRVQMIMDSVPEASLGTTTNHTFHLLTNNLQRLTVENGGLVGINKASLVQAQLQVVSQDATTETLILNSAASPSVNIAEFYNDNSLRFAFSPAANLGIGLSGAGGATGSITFNGVTSGAVTMTVAAAAGTWTLTLPTTAGSAGQFLQTNGAGVTTWATAGGGTPASPVNSVQFNNAGAFGGSSNMLWDNTNNRLLLGVTVASGQAPLDVLADGTALAQQWRQNAGPLRVQMILDNVPEASLGTTTNHTFHLLSNNLQRLTVENGGLVGINKAAAVQAQLQVVSQDATTETLILNSAASPSVSIAEFYNDSSLRFAFSPAGNLSIGLSGAGGATGSITFNGVTSGAVTVNVAAAAGTWTLTLPTDDGNAGQFLQTNGSGVTTWATAGGGATINPTDNVMPYRQNATTFGDSSLTITTTTLALSQATVARTSGAPTFYNRIITPADTGLTASTESIGHQIGGNTSGATVTRQWAAGALTLQREYVLIAPTYAFVAASTLTKAATVAITGAPTAGTNATITNSRALLIQSGDLELTSGLIWFSGTASQNGGLREWTVGGEIGGVAAFRADNSVLSGSLVGTGFYANQFNNNASSITIAINRTFGIGLGSAMVIGWQSASSGGTAPTLDTALARHAAAIIRATNGSTGIGSLLVAPSTASVTGNFTVLPDNAATNSIVTVARLGVNSTGTAADGFGAALSWSAETSTTNDTETGRFNVFWTTATHASRTSAVSWTLSNNASLAEVMRLTTPSATVGSPFVLNIHDGTNPNVWTAGAFAAKLYLISPTLPAVGVAAHFSATALDAPQWQMLRGRGTNASPTAVQNNDSIGNVEWWGQTSTSTNNVVAGARIRVSATENWSAGNNGCQMIFFVSNNAGTITERMSLRETGTLRIGATAGSFNTTTLLQVGNYSSWSTDVAAAIYTGANGNKGLEIIGTASATASLLRIFRDSLTPNLLELTAAGVLQLRAGLNTGTTTAKVGGTINENFTIASNSGTGETDLMTYSLPASTMGTNNDFLDIDVWGEFTAAASNKRVRLYFGSTVIFDTTSLAFGAGAWRIKAKVVRGSSTDQLTISTFSGNTALVTVTAQVAAPTATMSGAITIKCTGQSSVGSNEIFQEGLVVKYYPASN